MTQAVNDPISQSNKSGERNLRFATDCSGIDAAFRGLLNLDLLGGIDYVFASEIDPKIRHHLAKTLSEKGLQPKIFEDIEKRTAEELLATVDKERYGDIDLYVSGPPCPPYSTLGKQLGQADPRARVFEKVIETIQTLRPTIAIIENVAGFLRPKHVEFREKLLKRLSCDGFYDVAFALLNADCFGTAQNRPRVFIVAIRKPQDGGMRPPLRLPLANGMKRPSVDEILLPGTHPDVLREFQSNQSRVWPITLRDILGRRLDPRFTHVFAPASKPKYTVPMGGG